MVKICLILMLILSANLGAQNAKDFSALDGKIINLIGESAYSRNKSFINKIFSPKERFYKSGNLDIYRVISLLQGNGLLKLKFSAPQEFSVIFSANASPIFLLKTINQSLAYMGYSYFTPSEVEYEEGASRIKITLLTEHIIDPIILLNELGKSGFVSEDITQHAQNAWEYRLVLTDSRLANATFIAKGNSVNVHEISGEYWLDIGGVGQLEVSNMANRAFFPKIIFFDKNLNILEVVELSKRREFSVSIIDNTKFIKILDSHSNNNLKSGLNIRLK